MTNPAAREFARFARLVRDFGAEFGMTPSSVTDTARRSGLDASAGYGAARLLS